MNLNKYDKQAFVTAVMDDVPCVDYAAFPRHTASGSRRLRPCAEGAERGDVR